MTATKYASLSSWKVYMGFAIICEVQRNALCVDHVHMSVCDLTSPIKPLAGIS